MISVIFFVLICSKETKTEMNTKKVAHDSLHCTLIFCPHNFNSLFYFFYTIASFVPKGYSGFQETWMIILSWSSQLKKYLPNFSYPKRILESKISNPKILRLSPLLKFRSTSTGVSFHPKFLYGKFCLWHTSQPQNRLSITKLNRRYLQVKRKQPRMGKEPSIFYFLETEIHSTGNPKHPQLRWKCLQ